MKNNCALIIFPGGLEISSVQRLARIARGEDPMSGIYTMIADGIISFASFLYASYL